MAVVEFMCRIHKVSILTDTALMEQMVTHFRLSATKSKPVNLVSPISSYADFTIVGMLQCVKNL